MNIIDIINKKRLNKSLTYEELSYAFNGYLNKEIEDYQMSSLLMAITINGLSFEETKNLTEIFIDSGERYEYDRKVCDKHSTGGIGDTVTLVVLPILASLGIPVAKMSGRGLGITGGTIDKLESIPGFRVHLSKEDFMHSLEKNNIALSSQTDNLVPLDKVIYALRDVTGTTESIPLIASSIMSKKIASGASFIVIDVKCGEGALIKTEKDANLLSKWLIDIGNAFNVNVKTIITNMDEPLSNSIGNAIEVLEAIEVLKGKETKLTTVSVEVASLLISMYENIQVEDAKIKAIASLKNNSAYKSFSTWISSMGGDLNKVKLSNKTLNIKSSISGKVVKISALSCGKLALKLGSGRLTKDANIDYSVGIKLLKNVGDYVEENETVAVLYVNNLDLNLSKEDLNIIKIK